jgi:hypothetical protein
MSDLFSTPVGNTAGHYSATEKSLVVSLPKFLIIFAALTLIVDGALPQLEMAATGGSLLFMPRQPTILILCLGLVLLLKGRFQSSPLLLLTLILSAYIPLEALFLHFYIGLSFAAVRSALECFTFLAIAGVASVVPLQIKPRQLLVSLLLITFACLIITAAQFFTNTPIVRTESNDHAFHVQSYQFLDHTRGFSLFANGLEAGIFYSLMGGVATSFCLRRGTRGFGFVLLLLCAFGCYATYTRLVMIGFIISMFTTYVLSRERFLRFSPLLPVLSLSCAVLIVAQGLRTSAGAARGDLANASTLDQRVLAWGMYGAKFLAGSPTDILLGIGQGPYSPYSAPDRPENASPIPVDNAYLLVLLSSGVLGLALLSIAYWRFWMLLHTRAIASRAPLLKGIAGLFSTVPFFCFINDLPLQTLLLLLLAVSLADEDDVRFAPGLSAVPEQHLMLA